MRVAIFGATGFIGRGVLAEALASDHVDEIVAVGRTPTGVQHPKLVELTVLDLRELSPLAPELNNLDACFWCVGVSSAGMAEEDYKRITYDYALCAANALVQVNPRLSFCFVSGAGADGSAMWARVKKLTEQDLGRLPFERLFVFRPAFVQDVHGAVVRGFHYKAGYALLRLGAPVLRLLGAGTTNGELGRAMIHACRDQVESGVFRSHEVIQLAAGPNH